MQEGLLAGVLTAAQFVGRKIGDPFMQRHIGRQDAAIWREHLVIGSAEPIAGIGAVLAGFGLRGRRRPKARDFLRGRETVMLHVRNGTLRQRLGQAAL